MRKIIIKSVRHSDQPYDTVGMWKRDKKGTLHIDVSDMKNEKYELLVAIHELVETFLCENDGVSEQMVTDFDVEFERLRRKKKVSSAAEPGDDVNAPYAKQHCIATSVERLLCAALGLSWQEYDDKVMSL